MSASCSEPSPWRCPWVGSDRRTPGTRSGAPQAGSRLPSQASDGSNASPFHPTDAEHRPMTGLLCTAHQQSDVSRFTFFGKELKERSVFGSFGSGRTKKSRSRTLPYLPCRPSVPATCSVRTSTYGVGPSMNSPRGAGFASLIIRTVRRSCRSSRRRDRPSRPQLRIRPGDRPAQEPQSESSDQSDHGIAPLSNARKADRVWHLPGINASADIRRTAHDLASGHL